MKMHFVLSSAKWQPQGIKANDSGVKDTFMTYILIGECFPFNSLRQSDAYMRHQTKPLLVQMMACHLTGTSLLSEPMLE